MDATLAKMYESGMSAAAIAIKTGYSEKFVKNQLKI